MSSVLEGNWSPFHWHDSEDAVPNVLRAVVIGSLAGGACYLLYRINQIKSDWAGQLLPQTKEIIHKAYLYSLGSTALVAAPGLFFKSIGIPEGYILSVFYYKTWTAIVAWIGALTYYGVAMVYPSGNESKSGSQHPSKVKLQHYVGSSLALGTVLSPVFYLPRSLVAIAGGYTIAMIVPLAAVGSVAQNRLFLNIGGISGMLLGVAIMQSEILPTFLARSPPTSFIGRILESADTGVSRRDLFEALATVGLVASLSCMGVLLGNANSIVSRVEGYSLFKSRTVTTTSTTTRVTDQPDGKVVREEVVTETRTGGSLAPHSLLSTLIAEGVHPDDSVGLGLLINLYTGRVFVTITWELVKFIIYVIRNSKKSKRRA